MKEDMKSSTAYLELGIVHILVLPWLVDRIAQLPPETHVGECRSVLGSFQLTNSQDRRLCSARWRRRAAAGRQQWLMSR